jgi:glycogen debranching enzyme
MALEIAIGPLQLALVQGNSVLLTERDGQIQWPSDKGLYFFDTRVISSWSIYANGESWDLLNAGNVTNYASRTFLANRAIATEDGEIPPRTLGLVLSRLLDGGVHEDLDLVNHGMKPVRFNLEIAIRSDFADLFEVKSGHIVRRGRIATESTFRPERSGTAACFTSWATARSVSKRRTIASRTANSRKLARGSRTGGKQFSRSVPAMRSFIAFFVRALKIWPRYAFRSRVRTTCNLCRQRGCLGS